MRKGMILIGISCMLSSTGLLARKKTRVFVQYEFNDNDTIKTVGVANFIPFYNSDFGAQAMTIFSYAEVMTNDNYLEDYLAWEAGFRMGYYGVVIAYIEAGIDLTEWALKTQRNDCCESFNDNDNNQDQVDGYIGVGAVLQIQALTINAFARLRQIDTRYWQSAQQSYYGIQLSVSF
ncbi:MAG: hypothetical protein ACI8R9_001926 [Paraglaciecola sp.]|jgi:hypothetical protein